MASSSALWWVRSQRISSSRAGPRTISGRSTLAAFLLWQLSERPRSDSIFGAPRHRRAVKGGRNRMSVSGTRTEPQTRRSLLERLRQGPVVCAEGYLFECERRGYLQAGAFVPEVVLDHPEVVRQLHRDFVHAGSDVVQAFTYYGHRQKLRVIGKEQVLEPLNRQALTIAARVARETD